MGVLWIGGNVWGVTVLLIVVALISAFIAGLVAATIAGRRQIAHGVAAAVVLLLASTLNNILTGNFDLRGFFVGATIASALGYLGARAGRRITLLKSDQSTKSRTCKRSF